MGHFVREREALLPRIMRFFLEQKLVVLLLLAAIVGWGIAVSPFDWDTGFIPRDPVPVDAIPNLGENQQIVFTDWPGRSPQDVEDQVTYPLTVALMGVPGVREVRSQSAFGFSMIFLIFEEGVEFYWSRARIIEKLGSLPAGLLPEDAQPALGPDATALGQIFWYTLEGRDPDGNPAGGWDPQELRSIQDWYVRYGLLAAGGISEVASIGGYVKEYQVDVDPEALRAHDVTLRDVFDAVRKSNLDVGARVTEINRVEYLVRSLGFIENLEDIEQAVLRMGPNHVPIRVEDVAQVTFGPAQRRGALTHQGAEAVGGVVVVRDGYNPLEAIRNVKEQVEAIAPGLPAKAVVDWEKTDRESVDAFAAARGFEVPGSGELDQDSWVEWLRTTPREQWPEWITLSQVTVEPFYDRTDLIMETLATLNNALADEILVTIIVLMVILLHLRSALIISTMLPLAVLITFIAMKLGGVEANVVALSGIAIAIGAIVDMGIIITENILKHLETADPKENRLQVIYRGASEVGSAVLTAAVTIVISFLPVFTMTGAEGKLFIPLAFTKTFAMAAAAILALFVLPAAAHVFLAGRIDSQRVRRVLLVGLILLGAIGIGLGIRWDLAVLWIGGIIVGAIALYHLALDEAAGVGARISPRLAEPVERASRRMQRATRWIASALAVLLTGWLLARVWEPLGPEAGGPANFVFVAMVIGGLLGLFVLFMWGYGSILGWCLRHKFILLSLPLLIVVFGFGYVWWGPGFFFGPMEAAPRALLAQPEAVEALEQEGLLEQRGDDPVWSRTALGVSRGDMESMLGEYGVEKTGRVLKSWDRARELSTLGRRSWGEMEGESLWTRSKWSVANHWNGLGREFMPPLDEGSFLWMPSTMPHASIGEVLEVMRYQDKAIASVPEVESVTGKLGRAETALDPAPVSMLETIVHYKSEYITDAHGHRINFKYDREKEAFVRDDEGNLIEDRDGRPYRQWRDHIKSPDDIWDEIVAAAEMPGTTSAPKLQPIETRLVMLQTGMRAPMGVKIRAPDLETLDRMAVEMERHLRQVPTIRAETVNADRVVGKPYLEINIDRDKLGRYGLNVEDVQHVISVAIGGRMVTTTVEGRERYPVRVRYPRERRGDIDSMKEVLLASAGGVQIPLGEVAEIEYVRGPQMIRSEDTFLVAYVTFGGRPGIAEVDVVEVAQDYLQARVAAGELAIPPGVSWRFAGEYEHQLRAAQTLKIIVPITMGIIFLLLYFDFRSALTSLMVFSAVIVAWGGAFILIWLYGQPWFADFSVFGANLRELFQMGTVNLSVAVWVGFLALFGVAVENGIVIGTYLHQSFTRRRPETLQGIYEACLEAGLKRVRPCLMTTATTILALLPVLTSTGRGSDIMIPMAIPIVGGMLCVVLTILSIPVLFCLVEELKWKYRLE